MRPLDRRFGYVRVTIYVIRSLLDRLYRETLRLSDVVRRLPRSIGEEPLGTNDRVGTYSCVRWLGPASTVCIVTLFLSTGRSSRRTTADRQRSVDVQTAEAGPSGVKLLERTYKYRTGYT